ncbi:hypothetical protein PFISCL1PPCAC_6203 [Pristionchus fissidentatus]|uniref:peptide-methionine (S)-S-oxide reductase n=1 Tax=Pristionchus fissidentatus TaxID=1538716 RepID=A0AAV5V6A8_9BILA|nr:hypothetical protein PFISCL1PPCAC_6203 [Pristionchus fissidentatus]
MSRSRAYLGMQCFWGESSFAKIRGVVGTRVGYAGGTTPAPTYRDIGDHTEVTEVTFDPSVTTYRSILDWFWSHHDPTLHNKKQYQSAILWTNEEEKREAEESTEEQKNKLGKVDTYVVKLDKFHQAEDYHQKYWLRAQTGILKELKLDDNGIATSEIAAKTNAYLAGFTDFTDLDRLAKELNLSSNLVKVIKDIAERGGDPRSCH